MLKSSRETDFYKIQIASSFFLWLDSKLQVSGYQWTRLQILFPCAALGALHKIQAVVLRSLGPPVATPRGRGLTNHQATERCAHKVFSWGHFWVSIRTLCAKQKCVRYKYPFRTPTVCVETLRDHLFVGTFHLSGGFWELVRSEFKFIVHDDHVKWEMLFHGKRLNLNLLVLGIGRGGGFIIYFLRRLLDVERCRSCNSWRDNCGASQQINVAAHMILKIKGNTGALWW